MFFVPNNFNYPTARLKLANGLSGVVALSDSAGNVFSMDGWAACLAKSEELEEGAKEILKRDGSGSVIVKAVTIGGRRMEVVVKSRLEINSYIDLTRCVRAGRALRNFRKAAFLKKVGIPAETPLAALRQTKNIFIEKSIYVTEYFPRSSSLHWFVQRELPATADSSSMKKHLARQLAILLAALHDNGLWHRDAKPSNVLIHTDKHGAYKLMLIDLDGVKPYRGLPTFGRRFRAFTHLAALRLVSPLIYKTDCLRTFKIYCNLTGIGDGQMKRLFRRLAKGPVAKRLRKLSGEGR